MAQKSELLHTAIMGGLAVAAGAILFKGSKARAAKKASLAAEAKAELVARDTTSWSRSKPPSVITGPGWAIAYDTRTTGWERDKTDLRYIALSEDGSLIHEDGIELAGVDLDIPGWLQERAQEWGW